MRLSATLALRVAAIGVTVGAVAVPASLAHAAPHGTSAGPSITITPDTNVKNGSKVTVSGTGFPASQSPVYIVECTGTSGAAQCDINNLNTDGSTDASGNFSGVKVKVHTGTVGGDGSSCDPGGTCYIAASTSPSPTPDPSNSAAAPFTFAKGPKAVATKTTAKFSHHKIVGTVKAGGKGVKGLKAKLKLKVHGKWKSVASLTTHKHGAYASKKITRSGKYQVTTIKQTGYKASTSKTVTVS